MRRHPISIIIPVYKNYEMFYRYLSINSPFFEGCEVIVMNDYPGAVITRQVKNIIPTAFVFNNRNNLGFAGNVNRGISKASRDYLLLLNSDVVLKDDAFIRSLNNFKKDDKLFAVGFAQIEKNKKIVGRNCGYFNNGFINHSSRNTDKDENISLNFWAEGGAAIFRANILYKIGFLDPLFNPFYWEDIDLSYRAWKAGYKIAFDPKILVEHHHESTIGKYFDKTKILKTAFRNQLIFQWKNLTDRDFIVKHLFSLLKLTLRSLLKTDKVFLVGLFNAIMRLPQILRSRNKTVKLFIRRDKDILSLFT